MKVIIVGGGNTGSHLASLLLNDNHSIKIIESRPALLEKLKEELPPECVVSGDGSSPAVLEQAGISEADVLAAVTGSDETNLVITSLSHFEYQVPRTIARINNPKNAWLFTKDMGVDVALNQADILAHLVAEEMSLGDMITLLRLNQGQYSLVEEKVHPRSLVCNKTLREVILPNECTIVAIIRKEKLVIPHGDTLLQPVDEVLALVHQSHLQDFSKLLAAQDIKE